ncbi:YraN family protein [Flavobacteriaceae bacterium 14752]|uniref:YraN family protein n=1 Tax=Mesohalobacter salilacus TaxID=2491711 RepID=UPI000F63B1C6|nr:YraN family protein [Flavobacteriaceae bacterium 14752]
MAEHNQLGKAGESLALKHLKDKGYDILAKNYRFQKAEVDIIALKNETLVAVEVKTRSTPEFGNPQEFVKPAQMKRLVEAVDHFVNERHLDYEVRFDVIGIIKNKLGTRIEHLEDAFLHF